MSDQLLASVIVVAIMLLVGTRSTSLRMRWRPIDSGIALRPDGQAHAQPDRPLRSARRHPPRRDLHRELVRLRLGEADTVNPNNLEGGRYGEAIVAAAGLLSNLALAIVAALPLRYLIANPALIDQIPLIVLDVLLLFVNINLVLMLFNLFPIPPLDGSKVLFAFLPPHVGLALAPDARAYGFIVLLLIFFLPPGGSIGGRHSSPSSPVFVNSWWASKARQFRRTSGLGSAEERADWPWPPPHSSRALRFDACRRPPPRPRRGRHLRKDGAADDELLLAGLLHDAGKGHTGVGRGGLRSRAGVRRVGVGVSPGSFPDGSPVARLRDHAEISARLAGEAGCSARTVELIRHQDAPVDPDAGRHSSSPTRPTDGHGRDRIARRAGDGPGHDGRSYR